LHELPVNHVTALVISAAERLGVLELLFDSINELVALLALEGTELEFGLHFGCASDGAVDADEFAKLERLEVTNLCHTVQVVDTELIDSLLHDLVADVLAHLMHELHDSFSEVRLVSDEFAHHAVHEVSIAPLELRHVPKIDEEGCLLVPYHVLDLRVIVVDVSTTVGGLARVLLVVYILALEPVTSAK
jgi:hypothetical protein